jgi:predicted DNA binding protein
VLFVWASGGDFEVFEAALPEDPTINGYECIDDRGDRRLYRVVVDRDSDTSNPAPIDRQTGASRLSIKTTADGAVLRLRLPGREALTEYIRLLRDRGFTVELLRAHDADDGGGSEYDLSEKQAEALQEALGAGYFEVPRETDLERLAAEFDISEQAFSERLRRGVSSVLAATVGEPDEASPSADVDGEATAAVDGGVADDE